MFKGRLKRRRSPSGRNHAFPSVPGEELRNSDLLRTVSHRERTSSDISQEKRVRSPDLIIGIDFGDVETGVAYCFPNSEDRTIRWIQKWPGRETVNANKVPTKLGYIHGVGRPSVWGWEAADAAGQSNIVIRKRFKALLEPKASEQMRREFPDIAISDEDVRRWCRDYLTALYDHIKLKLNGELSDLDGHTRIIDFIFSVPASWSSSTAEKFRDVLLHTGLLGSGSEISLVKEPEAIAAFAEVSSSKMLHSDNILVVHEAVDQTAEISVVRATNVPAGVRLPTLIPAFEVESATSSDIGLVAVNRDFEELITERLWKANGVRPLGIYPTAAANQMVQSRDFENVRNEHGAADEAPRFYLPVPGLPADFTRTGIVNGELDCFREDLRKLFSQQIDSLVTLINQQLDHIQRPGHSILLLLSGKFCQVPYVQHRLGHQFAGVSDRQYPITRLQVVPDINLSVCKGLVAKHMKDREAVDSILDGHCFGASYGLVCREIFNNDNLNHSGGFVRKDSSNKQTYVENVVDWIVKKETSVREHQPSIHHFTRKCPPGDTSRIFPREVVVCYHDEDSLPYTTGPGVETLCEIACDFSRLSEDTFKKKRRFWKRSEAQCTVTYDVHALVDVGDMALRLEIWCEGQRLGVSDLSRFVGVLKLRSSTLDRARRGMTPIMTPAASSEEDLQTQRDDYSISGSPELLDKHRLSLDQAASRMGSEAATAPTVQHGALPGAIGPETPVVPAVARSDVLTLQALPLSPSGRLPSLGDEERRLALLYSKVAVDRPVKGNDELYNPWAAAGDLQGAYSPPRGSITLAEVEPRRSASFVSEHSQPPALQRDAEDEAIDVAAALQPKPFVSIPEFWQCACGEVIKDTYLQQDVGMSPDQERRYGYKDAQRGDEDARSQAHQRTGITALGARRFAAAVGSQIGDTVDAFGSLIRQQLKKRRVNDDDPVDPDNQDLELRPYGPEAPRRYLFLCITQFRRYERTAMVPICVDVQDDDGLFLRLREEYNRIVGPLRRVLCLKRLAAIRFAKFYLAAHYPIEIDAHSQMQHRVRDTIPPPDDRDYTYQPRPVIRYPPVGHNRMMHLYNNPGECRGGDFCTVRFPKHCAVNVTIDHETGEAFAWGIELVEGRAWEFLCVVGLFVIGSSMTFGVVWARVMTDVSGGFTVAAYMLGLLACLVGTVQVVIDNT